MPADDQLESVRHRCGRRCDDKASADAGAEAPRGGRRHRGRGLAGGDDANRSGTAEAVPYEALRAYEPRRPQCERALDQRFGRGRTNTGPDNRQEIVSKIGE
jgi:hypothetical protein